MTDPDPLTCCSDLYLFHLLQVNVSMRVKCVLTSILVPGCWYVDMWLLKCTHACNCTLLFQFFFVFVFVHSSHLAQAYVEQRHTNTHETARCLGAFLFSTNKSVYTKSVCVYAFCQCVAESPSLLLIPRGLSLSNVVTLLTPRSWASTDCCSLLPDWKKARTRSKSAITDRPKKGIIFPRVFSFKGWPESS